MANISFQSVESAEELIRTEPMSDPESEKTTVFFATLIGPRFTFDDDQDTSEVGKRIIHQAKMLNIQNNMQLRCSYSMVQN